MNADERTTMSTDQKTDLKELIEEQIADTEYSPSDIVRFLEDNNWFGERPEAVNGKVELTSKQVEAFIPAIQRFMHPEKTIYAMFDETFPGTASNFRAFIKGRPNNRQLDEEDIFYIVDFLLHRLDDELCFYSNNGVVNLLERAQNEMTKSHGIILTDFLAYLRANKKTDYTKDFIMTDRCKMTEQNEAYDEMVFCEILYHLVNAEYIEENDMYRRATEKRKYIDAWLYMTLHLICSVRYTDFKRLGHPDLPYAPEIVLEKIADGTFTDNEARTVLLYIVNRLKYLELTPNKNSRYRFIETIKFEPPNSMEPHLGRLFAIAEAHAQLEGDDGPIVRKCSTYIEIKRAMGDEIASIFLHRDFGARSATKSYLQGRFDLVRSILGNDENNLSARLISHARSHKGSYGDYAKTSLIYLQDAKFNGFSAEYIAFELLERGVLSFIPAMLLDMVSKGNYNKKDVADQTAIIKALDMSAGEVEAVVKTVDDMKAQAKEVVGEIINTGADIMTVLKRIAAGVAFSKEPECMCLLSAVTLSCPFKNRKNCIGCKYEISTKGTLFLLISEYNRIKELLDITDNEYEKAKYEHLICNKIVPALQEILVCLQQYDANVVKDYEELIKEFMRND